MPYWKMWTSSFRAMRKWVSSKLARLLTAIFMISERTDVIQPPICLPLSPQKSIVYMFLKMPLLVSQTKKWSNRVKVSLWVLSTHLWMQPTRVPSFLPLGTRYWPKPVSTIGSNNTWGLRGQQWGSLSTSWAGIPWHNFRSRHHRRYSLWYFSRN